MVKLKMGVLSMALISSCSALGGDSDRVIVEQSIRRELSKNWRSAYDDRQKAYLLISPAYPLDYSQGCVIYRQSFPDVNGKASFARMDFSRLYFATASDSDCSKIDYRRFFSIEEGSDYYGTLDFVRRIYKGPDAGRDKVEGKEMERLAACFAPEEIGYVNVSRAESKPLADTESVQYVIVLRCRKLGRLEEIYASGADRREEISWEVRTSVQVDVDDI